MTQPRFNLFATSSPNARKITLMLEELGQAYDVQPIRVLRGEQFAPEFRALNPLSKTPVLVDRETGGPAIFESGAILIYLAETFGRFLPAAGPARYETLQWLFAQTSNIGPTLGQYNHFRSTKDDAAGYGRGRFRNLSKRFYDIFNERLGAARYLAGDEYSIADIATFHWAFYLEIHDFAAADFPHLTRWRAEIAARPAAKREEEKKAQLTIDNSGFSGASKQDIERFYWRD